MNISDYQVCSNCGACYNICPHQAITLDKQSTFYTPVVDAAKCVQCGLCYERCPVNNDLMPLVPGSAWAGWHKDRKVVSGSSSGGAFHGFARSVLDEGGVVFGAVYSDDCREVIFASSDEVGFEKMQKSKYVESLPGMCFSRIKKELSGGRKVLFCGTPCQVAGLKAFLGREWEQLITCDFACGGLPSHKIYQDYLSGLERKYKSEAVSVDFRPKTHGWKLYAVLVKFRNKKVYNRLGREDPYLHSFLYGKCTVRDACLECKFSDNHQSDLTIADFWLHDRLSGLENREGISLILCNTEKGSALIRKIKSQYMLEEMPVSDVAYNNKKTVASPEERQSHDAVVAHFEENGFLSAYRKQYPFSLKDAVKNHMRRIARKTRGRNQ